LGCGYGRVLERLAQPKRKLVGLDMHEGLLARAKERLDARVELVLGDMSTFRMDRRFDRVLIPYCGVFCLPDDAAVQSCLQSVWRHLKPGGLLAMDGYVGEIFCDFEPEEGPDEEMVHEVVTVHDGDTMWRVLERSTYDIEHQSLEVTYVHLPDTGAPPVEGSIPQRFLLKEQLEAHLLQAGFVIERFGEGFEDEAYDPDGEVWSVIARRVA
jgi:SAM-dependent methyltransferase